ncbi:chemotaxis protein [Alteromonas sp. KUL42]|uniref:methyl-accepting chemotaxis protein n=1 Tax=Alteromonas sp. KUL42 TaxID=2480797 RepID=UPI0010361F45|nr:methyl-accepting chemotaxis protein [Alteromonas sp. KUL42]TAP32118.1 chemotaxis protein [Alteromonas sp. KUL42]GEA08901.1 chemotaxis protein [Alteromonas sp. KUL42]
MKIVERFTVAQLTLVGTGALFLSIAFLAYKDISNSIAYMNKADLDKELVTLTAHVERVAHHHAVERGLTAGFLANPSPNAHQKVTEQRVKADESIKSLKALMTQEWPKQVPIQDILQPLLSWEKNKARLRSDVDNLQGAKAFTFYSTLNKRALDAANAFVLLLSENEATRMLSQALLLAQMKESLGKRRGKLNAVFSKREINNSLRDEVSSYSLELSYLSQRLLLSLSGHLLSEYQAISQQTSFKNVEDIAEKAVSDSPDFTTLPSSSEWFAMATEQIGQVAGILGNIVDNVKVNTDERVQDTYQSLVVIISVMLFMAVFIGLIYKALITVITKQLGLLVANLDKIAEQGDLTIDVSMSERNELGEISRSVNTTILALRDLVRGLGESIAASSRLSGQLEVSSSQMLKDAGNTQQLTTNMASSVEEMAATSREIARSSLDTLSASKQLDELANFALQANEKIRNRMEVLSVDIKGVQKNAADMEAKVTEIGSILETINTLSDQTNLLALNAAIEAARAGEHGRGFAVVADEVRKLAQSSRESSDKISSLLASLRDASVVVVNDINKNVESITNSMESTVEGRETAQKVKEAASRVEDMANNMSSAAEQQSVTTETISKELTTVEDAAKHEVSIAQKLSTLSGEMKLNNEVLQRTIDGFKAD